MELTIKTVRKIRSAFPRKCMVVRNLSTKWPRLYVQVLRQTKFLDKYENVSFAERLYCIEVGFDDRPMCKTCGKVHVPSFQSRFDSYARWCSAKCQASDPECVAKSKRSRAEKYGNPNYNGIDKSRATRAKNNNGDWHAPDFGEKVKCTKFANHGDRHYINVEQQKVTIAENLKSDPDFWNRRNAKGEATKIANGHDAKWNNREKFKNTLANFTEDQIRHRSDALKLAAAERTLEVEALRQERRLSTLIANYGCSSTYEIPGVAEKISASTMDHYGVRCGFQLSSCMERRREAGLAVKYRYLTASEFDRPNFDSAYLSVNWSDREHEYEFTCLSCGGVFMSKIGYSNGVHHACPSCYPPLSRSESKAELELAEFISCECGFEMQQHDRSIIHPYELDMYVPELSVAVEYNGMFWHSDAMREDYQIYHKRKSDMCEERGIRLLHVFERDWLKTQSVIKENICGALRTVPKKLPGTAKSVRAADIKNFAESFGIELPAGGDYVAAFDGDDVVGFAQFVKSRYPECLGLCVSVYFSRAGYASLKAIAEARSCELAFAAPRGWITKEELEIAGFQFVRRIRPKQTIWMHGDPAFTPVSRSQFAKLGKNIDPGKYRKIFDEGRDLYILPKRMSVSEEVMRD